MKKIIALIALFLGYIMYVNEYEFASNIKYVEYKQLSEQERREVDCLTLNLYREARGEPEEGILAVAFVTLNRVIDSAFPHSVCKVVYQRNSRGCQFSWVCMNDLRKIDDAVYKKLRVLATMIYINKDEMEDPSQGALFYHANYVDPFWNKVMNKTAVIGNHIFYSIGDKNDK